MLAAVSGSTVVRLIGVSAFFDRSEAAGIGRVFWLQAVNRNGREPMKTRQRISL